MKIDDEVSRLMMTPIKDTPQLARDYIKYLSSMYGFCGEIVVTGFYHYCQAVLRLKTTRPDYKIDKQGKTWFAEHKKGTL